MESCQGVLDWLLCVKCPYICSTKCPIEKENAVEELKKHFNRFYAKNINITELK